MDPVQNLSIKIKCIHEPGPWQGVHGIGPKWGSMDPWSMFCPLDPKQSQNRVFKFKLSHCSFAFWQSDLCELGEIFVADPPSSGFMNGGRQNFPPILTSGMSLSSQANRSSDRLYQVYKRYGGVLLRFWPFNAYAHPSTFSLIVIPLMFLYVVQLLF